MLMLISITANSSQLTYGSVDRFFLRWQDFTEYRKERGKMLMSRKNQLLLEFSFWNEPVPREGPNIYELRSYQLRVRVHFIISSDLMDVTVWLRPIMPDSTQHEQQGGAVQTASRPCKDVNWFSRESQVSCTWRKGRCHNFTFPRSQFEAVPVKFVHLRYPVTHHLSSFFHISTEGLVYQIGKPVAHDCSLAVVRTLKAFQPRHVLQIKAFLPNLTGANVTKSAHPLVWWI